MEESTDNKNCECTAIFNRLSKGDRLKLRGAALSEALTGFARDDTEAHPGRYPLYAAYIFFLATPLPFPGDSAVIVGATLLWAKYSKSALAQKLNGRLTGAFNHASLVADHREFITQSPDKPDTFRVKNAALAWHTTKRSFEDSRDATVFAWKAFKNLVFK